MGLKIEEKAGQETQTYLDETNPHFEAVNQAFEAFEKDPSDNNRAAVKKAYGDYKTVRETVKGAASKNLTAAEQQAKTAKEAKEKALEEFKKKDLAAPANSLLKPEKLAKIKQYAIENGLTEKEATDLVVMEHNIIAEHYQDLGRNLEAEAQDWSKQSDQDPDLGGANKQKAEQLINALLDAKMPKELRELFNKSHEAKNPQFRKFLLNIAKAMEPAELKLGGEARDAAKGGTEVEFSKTAADAKARGIGA